MSTSHKQHYDKDGMLPFVASSPTSRAAAQMMIDAAPNARERVWAWLYTYGPATDKQMQRGLEMDGSTQRPRRVELFRAGRVNELGWIRQGNGRKAVLWDAI
jgi:hypothetical protein